MATIVTREGKGSKLTIVEMDDNFENLNTQGEDNAAAINSLETDKQDALGFVPVPNTRTVAGKPLSGNVTLVKADVGLSAVDNTSDANKPISTATQAALDTKASTAALTGGLALKATPEDIEVAIDNATTVYDGDTFEGKNFPIPGPDDPAVGTTENPLKGKGQAAVDVIEDGNMSPVTSNAVYDSIVAMQGGYTGSLQDLYDLIVSGNTTPAAPTSPVINNTLNTFGFTVNPSYADLSDYEYQILSGSITTVTANPFAVGDIDAPIGTVKVRVKAASGRNASQWLVNDVAFTAGTTTDIIPLVFQEVFETLEYNAVANSYKFNYVSGGEGWGNPLWSSGKKLLAGSDGGVYLMGGNTGSGLSTQSGLGFITTNEGKSAPSFNVGFVFSAFAFPGIGFIDNASGTIDFSDGINFVNGTDYRLYRTSGVWKVESSTDDWVTTTVLKTLTYTGSVDMYPVGDVRTMMDSSSILVNPRCSNLNNV